MKILSSLFLVPVLLAVFSLRAAELPDFIHLKEDGTFRVGQTEFMLRYYNSAYNVFQSKMFKERTVERSPERFHLNATVNLDAIKGYVTQTVTALAPNRFRLESSIEFPAPAHINIPHAALVLPAETDAELWIDGKPVELPKHLDKADFYRNNNAKRFELKTADGYRIAITGDLKITLLDSRQYGNSLFVLRFSYSPPGGRIQKCSLSMEFQVERISSMPIELKEPLNIGWDSLPQGTFSVGAVDFRLPDSNRNLLKLGLVDGLPARRKIDFSPAMEAGALNLLHAAEAIPFDRVPQIGVIEVLYLDGTKEQIKVNAGQDVNDRVSAVALSNAALGWGDKESVLYASSFPLQKKPVVALTFHAVDGEAFWLIAAATLTPEKIQFSSDAMQGKPIVLAARGEWSELEFERDMIKGSPLDFSFLNEVPAGEKGRVIAAPAGFLAFESEPGKPVRFNGATLSFSAGYHDKKMADKLADSFAATGYNLVRIHHHDTELIDQSAPDTLTLDLKKLDQLDYLVAAMKKRGIYVATDFYTNRVFKPGDNIPECDYYSERQMKTLIPVSRAAMENWKEFARRWMNHVNPYTGNAWKEEPALICINLINEEVLYSQWSRVPTGIRLYTEAFEKWKKEKGFVGGEIGNNDPVFRRFLNEIQGKCLDEQIRFCKEELKLKPLVTSLNYNNWTELALLRDKFDVVDNHIYFDHPSFPKERFALPFEFVQSSSIAGYARGPLWIAASRIFGKPFIVTEYNFCNPNLYRAEGGPLMGAYSALQDWSMVCRLAWSHSSGSIREPGRTHTFDAVNDPLPQLSDRIVAAMFRRGDVAAARKKFAYRVSSDTVFNGPTTTPAQLVNRALVSQLGVLPGDAKAPAGTEIIEDITATPFKAGETIVSDTGELRLNAEQGSFIVNTPRTESITLQKGDLAAGLLSVKDADSFQTIAAISLDNLPLKQSRSILVLHLTNVANTGMCFDNSRQLILRDWGKLPLLLRRGKAEIALKSEAPYRVTALSTVGKRLGEIKGTFQDQTFRFSADTACRSNGVMAYHLTR